MYVGGGGGDGVFSLIRGDSESVCVGGMVCLACAV